MGAACATVETTPYYENVIEPILVQEGDSLPVSSFSPDGFVPTSTSKYEKRGIAVDVPEWNIDNCIQCGTCAFVCPHACIRAIYLDNEHKKGAPDAFETKNATGKDFYRNAIPYSSQSVGLHRVWELRAGFVRQKAKRCSVKPQETQEIQNAKLAIHHNVA